MPTVGANGPGRAGRPRAQRDPGTGPAADGADGRPTSRQRAERKSVLLRLDPAVHEAIAHWASDEVRSVNAQIEVILRRALAEAGRLPAAARPMRRPGRPRAEGGSGATD